jgi:Phytanoyl-CoA dioxygenase (PhyH)
MSWTAAVATEPAQIPDFGGPWFMSPFFEDELSERRLDPETEALVRSFAERGYVILDDLGFEDFDALADRVTADVAPLHDGGRYNRIMDVWTVSDAVRALATSPRITRLLEVMYGRTPIPFQTLNFLRGSEQPTHSDAYHFHSYPKHFMCGVWVAFEDIDDSNGPLHYYPGSHRLPDYDFLCPHHEDELKAFVERLIPAYGLEKQRAYVKRGQGLIWAANLLHGGDPVADRNSTRLSQVTHYYFDDCSYYNPVRSDIARGKIFFRQIVDVGTGRLHPNTLNGGSVAVPLSSRLVTWQRALMRRLGRGVQRHVK